jgi:hypothetical protein
LLGFGRKQEGKKDTKEGIKEGSMSRKGKGAGKN